MRSRKVIVPLAGAVACLVASMGMQSIPVEAKTKKEWCQYPLAQTKSSTDCDHRGGSYTSR